MTQFHFAACRASLQGKNGIVKPDADGYYTGPIGGLQTYNSAGALYVFDEACKLFESSSIFMRRVKNGNMKGELGHPKRQPGMTDDEYMDRYLTVEETNIAVHFSEIWLDKDFGKKNPQYNNADIVGIMAKYKPSGPRAAAVQASMENPKENVNFSIRSLTRDSFVRGRHIKVLDTILSFDVVTEPGISHATKWDSPSMESELTRPVTKTEIKRLMERRRMAGMSVESDDCLPRQVLASMESISSTKLHRQPPPFAGWK